MQVADEAIQRFVKGRLIAVTQRVALLQDAQVQRAHIYIVGITLFVLRADIETGDLQEIGVIERDTLFLRFTERDPASSLFTEHLVNSCVRIDLGTVTVRLARRQCLVLHIAVRGDEVVQAGGRDGYRGAQQPVIQLPLYVQDFTYLTERTVYGVVVTPCGKVQIIRDQHGLVAVAVDNVQLAPGIQMDANGCPHMAGKLLILGDGLHQRVIAINVRARAMIYCLLLPAEIVKYVERHLIRADCSKIIDFHRRPPFFGFEKSLYNLYTPGTSVFPKILRKFFKFFLWPEARGFARLL